MIAVPCQAWHAMECLQQQQGPANAHAASARVMRILANLIIPKLDRLDYGRMLAGLADLAYPQHQYCKIKSLVAYNHSGHESRALA